MRVYVFTVRHPSLDPPEGTLEITAPSFADAIMVMARKCPGIHVIRLEFEYDPERIARA